MVKRYGYDGLNRLAKDTEAVVGATYEQVAEYEYDAGGNMSSWVRGANMYTSTSESSNRLEEVDFGDVSSPMEWNHRGNLTRFGASGEQRPKRCYAHDADGEWVASWRRADEESEVAPKEARVFICDEGSQVLTDGMFVPDEAIYADADSMHARYYSHYLGRFLSVDP